MGIKGILRLLPCPPADSFESAPRASPLISFNVEALTAKIEKASKFRLVSVIGHPHKKCSPTIFRDLRSKGGKVIELEERKYRSAGLRLIVNFQSPPRRHHFTHPPVSLWRTMALGRLRPIRYLPFFGCVSLAGSDAGKLPCRPSSSLSCFALSARAASLGSSACLSKGAGSNGFVIRISFRRQNE